MLKSGECIYGNSFTTFYSKNQDCIIFRATKREIVISGMFISGKCYTYIHIYNIPYDR